MFPYCVGSMDTEVPSWRPEEKKYLVHSKTRPPVPWLYLPYGAIYLKSKHTPPEKCPFSYPMTPGSGLWVSHSQGFGTKFEAEP